jgi:hypothetical protein
MSARAWKKQQQKQTKNARGHRFNFTGTTVKTPHDRKITVSVSYLLNTTFKVNQYSFVKIVMLKDFKKQNTQEKNP